jgi:hypothetical protein
MRTKLRFARDWLSSEQEKNRQSCYHCRVAYGRTLGAVKLCLLPAEGR